ncbi:hypothetical protein Poly30_27710 [Planctomycetes bacterium Poly30]|uniref:ATP-binding protein n=1 Tax=Saltatorellus ferox TaxID=2528018 RepID=A0A518ET54_9BACT|nr:hypothetical protein Poly30_27710 [Planctomycetes bacterium Poly30]
MNDSTDPRENSADDGLLLPAPPLTVSWAPTGSSGTGKLLVDLPGGAFVEKLNITSNNAREKVIEKLASRLTESEAEDLEVQLGSFAEGAAGASFDREGGGKLAERLMATIQEDPAIELFRVDARQGEGFATVPNGAYLDTFPIRSEAFENWLARRCFTEFKEAPSAASLKEVTMLLKAHAVFEGESRELGTRVMVFEDGIVLDLANDNREVVHVTSAGWTIKSNPEVACRFLRRDAARPLPQPVRGGSIADLRSLVNLADEDQWVLLCSTLLAFLYPRGPFPILIVSGEQGSAKSTLCRLVQALVDPNRGQLRRPPAGERDLLISAKNTWLLAFDNLSGLTPTLSDALCMVATGGGFATRRLYSDDEETIIECQRPVLMNGIDDLDERPDLLDRAVVLQLPTISDQNRRDEAGLMATFAKAAPGVLGAILDGLVVVLRQRSAVEIQELPRMADFAKTATAAESTLGFEPGAFMAAYTRNRELARHMVLEQDHFAQAVVRLVERDGSWSGTAASLLREAVAHADVGATRQHTWPRTAATVGKRVRRLQTSWRAVGLLVETGERGVGRKRDRIIRLRMDAEATLGEAANRRTERTRPRETGPAEEGLGFTDRTDRTDRTDGSSEEPSVRELATLFGWRAQRNVVDTLSTVSLPSCSNIEGSGRLDADSADSTDRRSGITCEESAPGPLEWGEVDDAAENSSPSTCPSCPSCPQGRDTDDPGGLDADSADSADRRSDITCEASAPGPLEWGEVDDAAENSSPSTCPSCPSCPQGPDTDDPGGLIADSADRRSANSNHYEVLTVPDYAAADTESGTPSQTERPFRTNRREGPRPPASPDLPGQATLFGDDLGGEA